MRKNNSLNLIHPVLLFFTKQYLKHNNELDVTEVIDVNFTEDRHGIYRNIPRYFHFTDYETGKNYKYYTKVKRVDVQNDEFDAESDSDNLTAPQDRT